MGKKHDDKKEHKHRSRSRSNSGDHQHMPTTLSIFNNVTVNQPAAAQPVTVNANTTDNSKKDGCTSCFKSMFKSLRP